ncbi:glucose PTS transporter subunit IIA [Oribacterium sp. FC2011]|uniref:glucose PTS transporter subunit IIA n=1 Tax=Oribacterium sp. FC2011 TaxID=1408311 RepID=UPI00067960C4|nr:glucose PTS transporter subunit IIA [Oribacterium sp. FC2011]
MKVVKALNNNMVLVRDENGNESICQGKGIGFQKKNGDCLEEDKIERRFIPENASESRHFQELFMEIPDEYWEIAEDVLEYARKECNIHVSDRIILPLCDHMAGSIERSRQNISLDNPMLWDVKKPLVKKIEISAPLTGKVVRMAQIPDEGFSSGALGEGVAILPEDGNVYAPADGVVTSMMDTKHAIGFTTDDGLELLIHVGIDTVELNGAPFEYKTTEGAHVKKGDLLMTADLKAIEEAGKKIITPIIVTNSEDYVSVKATDSVNVQNGDNLLTVV